MSWLGAAWWTLPAALPMAAVQANLVDAEPLAMTARDLVGVAGVPVIVGLPVSMASMTFRQSAAGAFSRPPSHVMPSAAGMLSRTDATPPWVPEAARSTVTSTAPGAISPQAPSITAPPSASLPRMDAKLEAGDAEVGEPEVAEWMDVDAVVAAYCRQNGREPEWKDDSLLWYGHGHDVGHYCNYHYSQESLSCRSPAAKQEVGGHDQRYDAAPQVHGQIDWMKA